MSHHSFHLMKLFERNIVLSPFLEPWIFSFTVSLRFKCRISLYYLFLVILFFLIDVRKLSQHEKYLIPEAFCSFSYKYQAYIFFSFSYNHQAYILFFSFSYNYKAFFFF
jgi:hypothetical protein